MLAPGVVSEVEGLVARPPQTLDERLRRE